MATWASLAGVSTQMPTMSSLPIVDDLSARISSLQEEIADCHLDDDIGNSDNEQDPNKPFLVNGQEVMPMRALAPLTLEEKMDVLHKAEYHICTAYHTNCVARKAVSTAVVDRKDWEFQPEVTLVVRFGQDAFPCPAGKMQWRNPNFRVAHAIQIRDWYMCMCRLLKPKLGAWMLCGFRVVKDGSEFHVFERIKGAKPDYEPYQFDNLFITDVTLMFSRFYPVEMREIVKKNIDAPASWEVVKL